MSASFCLVSNILRGWANNGRQYLLQFAAAVTPFELFLLFLSTQPTWVQ